MQALFETQNNSMNEADTTILVSESDIHTRNHSEVNHTSNLMPL